MIEIKDHQTPKFYCVFNDDKSVFHIGILDVGLVLASGQPYVESFDTEAELELRVDELMGEGYYKFLKQCGEDDALVSV